MRPEFDSIKDFKEFSKYYWYRSELIEICKKHGLKHDGNKIELIKIIESYYDGNIILQEKKVFHNNKIDCINLSLNMGLIESGFTFGNKFREFFSKQTGVPNFKYTADMAATVKTVKKNNDMTFTLGDLLDIYYGRKTYVKYDKSILLWNNFVKAFCEDEATSICKKRLKSAASLWKIVRDSDMKKEYSRELFDKYKDTIIS